MADTVLTQSSSLHVYTFSITPGYLNFTSFFSRSNKIYLTDPFRVNFWFSVTKSPLLLLSSLRHFSKARIVYNWSLHNVFLSCTTRQQTRSSCHCWLCMMMICYIFKWLLQASPENCRLNMAGYITWCWRPSCLSLTTAYFTSLKKRAPLSLGNLNAWIHFFLSELLTTQPNPADSEMKIHSHPSWKCRINELRKGYVTQIQLADQHYWFDMIQELERHGNWPEWPLKSQKF